MFQRLVLRHNPKPPIELKLNGPVSANTPKLIGTGPVTDEVLTCLKGVVSLVKLFQQSSCHFSGQATVYRCSFFVLMYYPPEHYLAMARKSKPAILITYADGHRFNANYKDSASTIEERLQEANSKSILDRLQRLDKVLQNTGSRVPRDRSYQRVKLRKLHRPIFLQAWRDLGSPSDQMLNHPPPGTAKDGLYHYRITTFPDTTTKDEYSVHVQKSVAAVANLNWTTLLGTPRTPSWVTLINSRLNVPALNHMLEKGAATYKYWRTKKTSSIH